MASAQNHRCRVIILGSTGSIGTQTLQVIDNLNSAHRDGQWPTRYQVVGLAAGQNEALLREQAERSGVRNVAQCSAAGPFAFGGEWRKAENGWRSFCGDRAALQLIEETECDLVVSAITGAAGLPATLRAVELGRDVALANKETLVAAGALVLRESARSGARLLPIDSEHSGVWQALGGAHAGPPPLGLGSDVARVTITASGGPFRTWTHEQLRGATPEQALQHPTWRMGPKVTIDSASLMNKALEVIEAHWLFGLDAERIGVLIHPQSIVHAMIEFADGSTVAQLGPPDMRGPIQFALTGGRRAGCVHNRLDWRELKRLEFEEPDPERFPGLGLAYRAIREGGTAGAVLNAANEEAVRAFLSPAPGARSVRFTEIPAIVAAAMDDIAVRQADSLEEVLRADGEARAFVRSRLGLG
jgi:1-deoxy-D-xylulose-5-phosphate reductoisomerase